MLGASGTALSCIRATIDGAAKLGRRLLSRPASADTWAAAMLVPDSIVYVWSRLVLRMFTPGAAKST